MVLRAFAWLASIGLHLVAGFWIAVATGAIAPDDVASGRMVSGLWNNRFVTEIVHRVNAGLEAAAKSTAKAPVEVETTVAVPPDASEAVEAEIKMVEAVEKPASQPAAIAVDREPTGPAHFGDWRYDCEQQTTGVTPRCFIVQAITRPESKNPLFVWRITRRNNGEYVSTVQTPTNVLMEKGLVITVDDDRNYPIPFEQCYPDGCLSEASLAPDFLDIMMGAHSLSVIVYTLNGKGVRIVFGTEGLARAMSVLADPTKRATNS